MEIDYSQATLRQLKGMRKFHRKYRMDERHHTLFRMINAMIKKRQASYFEKQAMEFKHRLIKYLGKITK
jgi:hemerythrin